MKLLYLIPARGGSKGVPNKNIRLLDGKPLIQYTIEAAQKVKDKDSEICISTDCSKIASVANSCGVEVPFMRPHSISGDHATSEEVMIHALDYYKSKDIFFDFLVMLQPTSPLRNEKHILDALSCHNDSMELLVSVKETDANPYYVLFEESNDGTLDKCMKGTFTRRQDCPKVYELNGAIYIVSVNLLYQKGYQQLKMSKYLMDKKHSIDIDDMIDFKLAELILKS